MITDAQLVWAGAKALRLAEEATRQHFSGNRTAPGEFPTYVAGLAPAILTVLIARGVQE